MGRLTGTLPDGRRARTALANGFSPSQGTDLSGPTAVVKSTVQTDHSLLGNGMVLDLKFSPSFFRNYDKALAFRHLVETYFRMGGMEIQFNVIDRKTLEAAREHPEQYRDLIVRVSGFSAYFVDISKETQDEIIARTEHAGV
jgi:formate C-acetyltransferase